jgi:hypothetical protein
MYYPNDDWIPLRDAVSKLDLQLAPLLRGARGGPEEVSDRDIDRRICAAAWSLCDNCQTAVLTSGGPIVFLSKSLFTRDSNDTRSGDFLKLDIGQLGSQDWPMWAGLVEHSPDEDALSEEELERVLHPFYRHHVLIRKSDFEKQLGKLKKEIKTEKRSASSTGAAPRGRPPIIHDAADIYKELYPNGHAGRTANEVIDSIASKGGPKLSPRSFGRMVQAATEGQNSGQ